MYGNVCRWLITYSWIVYQAIIGVVAYRVVVVVMLPNKSRTHLSIIKLIVSMFALKNQYCLTMNLYYIKA